MFLWFRFFNWNKLPNYYAAVLTIRVAVIVFSPEVVPYFLYCFLYTSDLCHKCSRTGSQSGCLGTETFSVITKALPNCVILLSFNFYGLSIDCEQIFFLVYTPRLTVIKIFPITAVLTEKNFCHIVVFPSKPFFSIQLQMRECVAVLMWMPLWTHNLIFLIVISIVV